MATKTKPPTDGKVVPAKKNMTEKRKSAAHAKAAFNKFTVSKYVDNKPNRNYVAKEDDVGSRQRELIKDQIDKFRPTGPGMSIELPADSEIVPEDGRIDLAILIEKMEQARNGSQFYTAGTSLIDLVKIQNRITSLFDEIKRSNHGER